MVGDDAQHVGEIFLGIDVIELGGTQEAVEGGGSVATSPDLCHLVRKLGF